MRCPFSDGLPYEKRADGKSEEKCIAEEVPFALPEGWSWTRLGMLGDWKSGATPKKSRKDYHENGTIPWLLTGDLNDGHISAIPHYITELALKECSVRLNPIGSILVAMYGATIGKIGILDIPATTNQACCACILVEPTLTNWIFKWLIYYKPIFEQLGLGGAQPNISRDIIIGRLVPIPPLSEQRRIVATLDKYLALVDGIERDRAELDGLFAKLKSKVLDLAVRGELAKRDPADEPANELLARIHKEKLAMVEHGELKTKDVKGDTIIFTGSDGLRYEKPADGKGEAKCIESEIPFEIPEGWSWARLGQLVVTCGGKTPSKVNKKFWEGGGVPWITSKDMKAPELFGSQIELSKLGAAETNLVQAGSVLMVVRSGILRRMLPVAINRVETTINQDLKAMTPYDLKLSDWFLTCFNAWDKRIRDTYHKDGTTVDSIEFDAMLAMLVPIPPLAEQRCIVDSIEAAFSLTNL